MPCPTPGHLPNSGVEPTPLTPSCIGRWVLYLRVTWEARPGSQNTCSRTQAELRGREAARLVWDESGPSDVPGELAPPQQQRPGPRLRAAETVRGELCWHLGTSGGVCLTEMTQMMHFPPGSWQQSSLEPFSKDFVAFKRAFSTLRPSWSAQRHIKQRTLEETKCKIEKQPGDLFSGKGALVTR